MTGPISGDTNIAATMFDALFSIKPKPANELRNIQIDDCMHSIVIDNKK